MGEPLKIKTPRAEKYPRIENPKAYKDGIERIFGPKQVKGGRFRIRVVNGQVVEERLDR